MRFFAQQTVVDMRRNQTQSYKQTTNTHSWRSKMKHKDEKNSLPILFFPANHNRKEKEVKQIKDCDGFRLTVKMWKTVY